MTVWGNGSKTKPKVSSKYGLRTGGAFSFHYGTDFVGYTDLKAILGGTVTQVGRMNASAGNVIVIDSKLPDGRTVTIVRMHAASWSVSRGQKVSEGQVIGKMGDTGNATGKCDHVEIRFWVNGKVTHEDPEVWIANMISGGSPAGSSDGNHDGWTDTERQQFLTSLGLDTGGVGNGWGPKSKAATVQFQTWVGLNPDGLFGADTGAVGRVIQKGGNWTKRPVAEIQTFLAGKGYPVGAIDGQVGNKFNLGTYMFQRAVGLKADAQWGDATDAKAFPPAPTPEPIPGRNATDRPLAQIQSFLKVPTTGVWDKATSEAVGEFQENEGITVDYVWGVASDGLAFPPAGSLHGVDYSFARPDPKMLASRGIKLVGRYLWNSTYTDGRVNKGISKAELAALRAAGLEVFFIYEENGKELLGGFNAGVRVATAAEQFRAALGLGTVPIYFNVDFDAPTTDMPAILDALDGAASVVGLNRVGLYAGIGPIAAAFDAGKITWGFQTYAWSGGKWDPRAQLQQWANGQWGGSVDFTRAVVAEYGQHPIDQPDPDPKPDPATVIVSRAELEAMKAFLEKWLA